MDGPSHVWGDGLSDCRDARKVTGDAMEVRGGCGYIEEWSDPRLVISRMAP